MRYITFHIQRDRRITLGTVAHKDIDCFRLSKANLSNVIPITGEILNLIPKCGHCFKEYHDKMSKVRKRQRKSNRDNRT